jgi:short-subunit dehydrogenase
MTDKPLAVVTGAARGIGRQISEDLIARGYRVVIGDLDLAQTTQTATELGDAASAVRLDVTDGALIRSTIDRIESDLGPIELWVNNAGIMPTGGFVGQKSSVLRATIDINYAAVVDATRAILPLMLERGEGTIVNIASATGIKPLAGLAVYSGTKAAIIAFSDVLRRELRGSGLQISVIAPNLVTTALGAGITPPALTGSVNAATVSRAVMRALDSGRFLTVVPRRLAPLLRFSASLPITVRDWLDDVVGSDRIGLGGDPATRAAYLDDALRKNEG